MTGPRHVIVVGEQTVSVPVDGWREATFDVESREVRHRCATGEVTTGVWAGVPVFDLILAASIPSEVTHLQAAGVDGFCTCIEVADLRDGLLAFERVDTESEALPRILGKDIEATRSVQEVRNLVGIALDPGDDREHWEWVHTRSSTEGGESSGE